MLEDQTVNVPLLSIKGLYKIYHSGTSKTTALKGISFSVEKGKIIAIVGPSGSGKTTLLSIMGGLMRPSSGSVIFKGRNLAKMSVNELNMIRTREIGFILQADKLDPKMTAIENIVWRARFGSYSKKDARRLSMEILKEIGIEQLAKKRISELSRGQRQKISIARAVVIPPILLFADEPTGNLDSVSAEEILDLITKISHQNDLTLIMATHHEKVTSRADTVLELDDGTIAGIHGSNVALEELEKTRKLVIDDSSRVRIPREVLRELGNPKVVKMILKNKSIILRPEELQE
ncbi:MAG: ABC transporter ATP-binding protein [Candidatus Hodarchaeales archaeon]